MTTNHRWRSVVALSGGVGGARLLHGLSRVLEPEALTAIVNTGDDFEHWGLCISPDLDTVMYTLADLAPEERGWGLSEESFNALAMVRRYGGDDWFALGDRDLATHLVRTEALRRGEPLSAVTRRMNEALGVRCRVLPMADAPCRTIVETTTRGDLPFQTWFVRHRAEPRVTGVRFEGSPPPAPGLLEAIARAEVVIIGPSNPYVSIDPIFSLPGVRDAVFARPVVAVSPIVNGEAVKGPLATMIPDLAHEPPSPAAIVRHYGAGLRGIVVERGDAEGVRDVPVRGADTIMKTREERSARARGARVRAGAAVKGLWAVVPVKCFARGKSRLGDVFAPSAREDLARALSAHVLATLAACDAIDGVLVATDCPLVARFVEARGALVVRDEVAAEGRGSLADVIDRALSVLARRGASAALVLMADLPLLAVEDVRALAAGLDAAPIVLAPDRAGNGTNALALSPPDRIATCFGSEVSFHRHVARARDAGIPFEAHRSEGVAFDLDSPADVGLVSSPAYADRGARFSWNRKRPSRVRAA